MSVEVVLQSTDLLGMKVKILNYLDYMLIKHGDCYLALITLLAVFCSSSQYRFHVCLQDVF